MMPSGWEGGREEGNCSLAMFGLLQSMVGQADQSCTS